MSLQSGGNPDGGFAHHNSLEDPAFEPQSGFDFDDSSDGNLRHYQHNLASLNAFDCPSQNFDMMGIGSDQGNLFAGSADPFPVGSNAFNGPQSTSSHAHINPSNVWDQSNISTADPFGVQAGRGHLSRVMQDDIVKSRGASVTQHFGQITPPDDNALELSGRKKSASSTDAPSARPAKMDKSERARNAAIQRHSKSKKAREERKDSQHEEGSDNSDDAVEGKREKYREKNRLAAAKCRAKKKTNVEVLEDSHRHLAARNNFMKRQERELRDELTVWRTMALQHNEREVGCQCSDLHQYNTRKASEVAFGWGQPAASSPSDSMGSMGQSPDVLEPVGSRRAMPGGMAPQVGKMPMPLKQESFVTPSPFAFANVTTPESMQQMTAAVVTDDGQHAFSSFLQSSPGGRAGFA